ncbi:MAG: DNA translocase FtsK 4TM domain-containing protein [Bacteroidota bacterium]|nr:DNA translocase FtsK 4TM domain-containing protein [Bacteroidota bacterium]
MANKYRTRASEVGITEPDIEKNDIVEEIKTEKKATDKKNKVKEATSTTTKKEASKSAAPKKEKISLLQRWEQVVTLYKNERTQKILGLSLVLSSVYLAIAFTSYFFTWDIDQDKVMGSTSELFSPETKTTNWLGKVGALISHFFIYKGFGAASFFLVPVLFAYGAQKMIQKKFINIGSFNAKWLFLMVWSSLLLGYIFNDKLFYLGGGFGYFVDAQISNFVGNIGLIALLGFSMLTFLVVSINLNFKLPTKPVIEEDETIQNEIVPETTDNTVKGVEFNSSFNELKELKLTPEEEAELLNFEIKQKGDDLVIEPVNKANVDFEVLTPQEEVIQKTEEEPILIDSAIETSTPETKTEPEFEIEPAVEEPEITDDENKAQKLVAQFGEYDPTLDLGSYKFPSFDLLTDYGDAKGKVTQEELVANKDKIVNTLKNFGIEIEKIMATVGPTVTLYEIVPAAGVRISKIKNLEDDIALSLAALGIRIIAPIPGKGTIGIEVPNQNPEMVPMKNILASEKFNNSNFELPIALGKTISNEIFIADLAKMPHLLMAGATGQGKSVGLNAVLVSLLYKKHPSQVKFVLVDPKKVELTLFKKIERHFLAKLPNAEDAIITDNTKVIHTLNSLCIEMDNRYALLEDAQVRNIKEYNTKFINRKLNPNDGHKFLPYIVLVVDEFADLIMTAGKEVETPIARLAQLARAIGIHLIIATQRPSVNIITGTIKANFPARIAFRVTSKIDSRTILDSGGADQLIGRGDMLLSTGNDLIRIQCAFVDTPEVEKITDFIGNQRAYPTAFMLPEYVGEDGSDGKEEVDLSERDKMFDDAAKLVVQFQQGSASFLQRKLKLGYNRAGRIVDQLEAAGIIGPFEGSKAREVLCKDMEHLNQILQNLRNK